MQGVSFFPLDLSMQKRIAESPLVDFLNIHCGSYEPISEKLLIDFSPKMKTFSKLHARDNFVTQRKISSSLGPCI